MNFIALSQRLINYKSKKDKIVVAYFKEKEFQHSLFPMKPPEVYQAYMVSSEGHVYSTDNSVNIIDIDKVASYLLTDNREKGIFSSVLSSSSPDRIIAFRKIPNLQLTVITVVSTKDEFSFWYKKLRLS